MSRFSNKKETEKLETLKKAREIENLKLLYKSAIDTSRTTFSEIQKEVCDNYINFYKLTKKLDKIFAKMEKNPKVLTLLKKEDISQFIPKYTNSKVHTAYEIELKLLQEEYDIIKNISRVARNIYKKEIIKNYKKELSKSELEAIALGKAKDWEKEALSYIQNYFTNNKDEELEI